MEENKRVLLGMSGGLDSSVAALLLKEQGYEVIGATLDFFNRKKITDDNSNISITNEAKKICDFLEIPHYTYNLKNEFNKYVIGNFCTCYANCKTPNPCIECNKYFKFGFMYNKAKELGCKYIATGHYAKTEYSSKFQRWVLKKSNNLEKDQSYVLWNISEEILKYILFPLGNFKKKEEIRKIAIENNLSVSNEKESQDICFVPNGDYRKFLENEFHIKHEEGNIVDTNGNILGKHKGLYCYTIGQRKGLGISAQMPLFVIGFNKEKNEVILGKEEELYKKELLAEDINLLLFDEIDKPLKVMTKIRYSRKEFPSTIYNCGNGKIKIIFDEPQRAITPGQSAVFYLDDIVIRRRKDRVL